jgi:hypothetical protein
MEIKFKFIVALLAVVFLSACNSSQMRLSRAERDFLITSVNISAGNIVGTYSDKEYKDLVMLVRAGEFVMASENQNYDGRREILEKITKTLMPAATRARRHLEKELIEVSRKEIEFEQKKNETTRQINKMKSQ